MVSPISVTSIKRSIASARRSGTDLAVQLRRLNAHLNNSIASRTCWSYAVWWSETTAVWYPSHDECTTYRLVLEESACENVCYNNTIKNDFAQSQVTAVGSWHKNKVRVKTQIRLPQPAIKKAFLSLRDEQIYHKEANVPETEKHCWGLFWSRFSRKIANWVKNDAIPSRTKIVHSRTQNYFDHPTPSTHFGYFSGWKNAIHN